MRQAWPEVRIELRAEGGFALPAVYEYCEQQGIHYTVGLIPNPRLEALAAPLMSLAELVSVLQTRRGADPKVRLLSEKNYEAGSWAKKRRVVYKAEVME